MLAAVRRAYDRRMISRAPRRRSARSLTALPGARMIAIVAIAAMMVIAAGCIGRGNTDSTGPARNGPTAAAKADEARTPFTNTCHTGVTPEAATERVNQEVTVIGPVVAAHYDSSLSGAPTYIEMGAAYPDPKSLSVVILGASRAAFPAPPEQLYQGKTICVIGVVQNYMQRKAIIAGQPESISVISNNASTP
jgi:hypothetical protein